MAIKIPDAPNIVGTQPVLRQPEPINAKFENPQFRVDVSAPAEALKNVGDAYADYVDQQTETLMGAACNQFSHDVREEENRLKNTYKGIYANDLYARLEKKAASVLDDMTGEPKDDGRVRIANPELRKRFRDWASKQMPAYHARMTNYTATEIERANKVILEDGVKQVNNMVADATTSEELMAANDEYIRIARLTAAGLPQGYQRAEAARMLDEAVAKKMTTLASTNILQSIYMYDTIPEIRAAMSETSEAAWQKVMQENYNSQGASRIADLMAGDLPTSEFRRYTDKDIIRRVFPKATEAEVDRILVNMRKEGSEIYEAAKKSKSGQDEKEYAALQTLIVNTDITNADKVAETRNIIAQVSTKLAAQYEKDVQTQLYEASVMDQYEKEFPFGDVALEDWEASGKSAAKSEYNRMLEEHRLANNYYDIHNTQAKELIDKQFTDRYGTREDFVENRKAVSLATLPSTANNIDASMARLFGEEETAEMFGREYSIDFEPRQLTAEQANILNEQRRIVAKNAQWINNPVYARVYAEAIDGRYHGEYRPELDGCPSELKKNLSAVVEYNRRYNEVVAMNPQIDNDVKNALPKNKKNNSIFVASVQREVVKGMDAYSRDSSHKGSYPVKGSIEYRNIINQAIHNAVSPTEARVGAYLNEQQIDLAQKAKIDPYLNPKGTLNLLKENEILPNEAVILLNKEYSAKQIADAIINTAEGAKKRRLEMYRDAMIQSIELTGNYDGWFLFADGIGQ